MLGLRGINSHSESCFLVPLSTAVLRALEFWFPSIWALEPPGLLDNMLCSLLPSSESYSFLVL